MEIKMEQTWRGDEHGEGTDIRIGWIWGWDGHAFNNGKTIITEKDITRGKYNNGKKYI